MYKAIAANKRNTLLIMAVFVGLISAIGYLVSLYFGNSSITVWVLAGAAIYAFIQYFAASSIALSMTGAEEIQKKDNPRLFRVVENLAITLGIPTPKVYLINDPAPNAFATGRDPKHAVVAATTGLLEIMDDSELEAVMAHEMGHVQNYDIRVSMIAFGLVSVIGILADVVLRMFFFSGDRRDNNLNPIVIAFGLVIVILAPIIATIIQLAISRQREYLADATSVLTTHDSASMVDALQKLQTYGRPMQKQNTSAAHLFLNDPLKPGFVAKLFSTHPPLADRIKRLESSATHF
ncbi:M48 family metalloprotease [Candidatus Saccharibacteria bacterium]|nr:M48 family metalloprotease [Candidatus Saccharibacteria bacterium]